MGCNKENLCYLLSSFFHPTICHKKKKKKRQDISKITEFIHSFVTDIHLLPPSHTQCTKSKSAQTVLLQRTYFWRDTLTLELHCIELHITVEHEECSITSINSNSNCRVNTSLSTFQNLVSLGSTKPKA